MFAVIYRCYLKPDCEADFKQLWHKVANYFTENCGAIGSTLHQTEDRLWVAYSRWPDKAARDASWPSDNTPSNELPDDIKEAILGIKGCLDPERQFPDICMKVIDDVPKRKN